MNVSQEKLYSIGEVAKLTGVSIKTIRYYADIHLLPPAQRTEARFRLYSTRDIWQLQLIRVLRQLEFSLEEIRAIIGGNLSINTAIDWQLDAVTRHIHQLQRIQEVLQQASEATRKSDQSLHTLYELGIALNESATERSRFVTEKLQALVGQANLPDAWRQSLLDRFNWQSPEAFTAQQTVIWTEIVAILNDPGFAQDALRFNSPAQDQTSAPMDITEHNQKILAMIQKAQQAALKNESGDSETVQALATDWARYTAGLAQQAITSEFLHKLSTQVSTFYSTRIQRFWTLIASLNGCEAPPSYEEGLDLLAAGLCWLARQPVIDEISAQDTSCAD